MAIILGQNRRLTPRTKNYTRGFMLRFRTGWMICELFQFGVEYLSSQNSGFWDSLYVIRPEVREDSQMALCP